MRKSALAVCALAASLLVFAAPAPAAPTPGASKNVELVGQLPDATNATAINFLEYKQRSRGHGNRGKRVDVMLVTGRFGLKSYSLANRAKPRLLDEVTAEDLRLPGDPPSTSRPSTGRRARPSGRTRTWTSTGGASSRCCRATRAPTPARPRANRVSPTPTARPTSPGST